MLKVMDSILWATATVMLVISGIYYTIKLHFVQFDFKQMIKNIRKSNNRAYSLPYNFWQIKILLIFIDKYILQSLKEKSALHRKSHIYHL